MCLHFAPHPPASGRVKLVQLQDAQASDKNDATFGPEASTYGSPIETTFFGEIKCNQFQHLLPRQPDIPNPVECHRLSLPESLQLYLDS